MKLKRLAAIAILLVAYHPSNAFGCVDTTPDNLIDGYCQQGLLVPGMISDHTYYTPPPQYFTTRALFQSPGVMEATAKLKGFDGTENYVALLPPMTSGWKAFIRMPDLNEWIPVRVVDVSAQKDEYFEAVYDHSGLELSYRLAKQLGVVDNVNPNGDLYTFGVEVCICDEHPEEICGSQQAVDFQSWYESILSFRKG